MKDFGATSAEKAAGARMRVQPTEISGDDIAADPTLNPDNAELVKKFRGNGIGFATHFVGLFDASVTTR